MANAAAAPRTIDQHMSGQHCEQRVSPGAAEGTGTGARQHKELEPHHASGDSPHFSAKTERDVNFSDFSGCRPTSRPSRNVGTLLARAHVHEARVVALERDGDDRRRAVPVLGHDEVGLAGARALLLVRVLAVQQQHHVRVLLDTARFA
ncbi:MAG: hypothetical protein JWO22_2077 [Frankiales bacterium]|nr:hypothetical protein [Frankiales bacterium]